MNEEETIRLFLKNGYQISKKALPLVLIDPEQIIAELGKLKPRPLFVTEEHIKNIFAEKAKLKPQIIREYKKTRKKIKIEDYVKCLSIHYEKIKAILLERMYKNKPISMNKIPSQTSVFSVIGIVRERRENNIILEDPSGEACMFFDDELKQKLDDIHLDDIIGVDCKKIKEKIYVKNIYFPDIPSSREVNKTEMEMKIAILSDLKSLSDEKFHKLISLLEQEKNLSLVFTFTDQELPESLLKFNPINITQNANPQLFQISGIKTLILPKHFFGQRENITNPTDFIVSILKRRNIIPSFNSLLNAGDGCFVLDEVPDIVISDFDESNCKNYKGTTIVSNSDSSKVFLINLKTREIEKKEL